MLAPLFPIMLAITLLTLAFLPAMYAIWFRIRPLAPEAVRQARVDEVAQVS